MLRAMNAEKVVLYTDSQLVSQQILGNFEVKDERMFRYASKAKEMTTHFSSFVIRQIAREKNGEADELARLASDVEMGPGKRLTLLRVEVKSIEEAEVNTIDDKEDWSHDIIQHLRLRVQDIGTSWMARRCTRYFLLDGCLYKRGFNNPHLKCLSRDEGEHLLQEIHSGCCGSSHWRPRSGEKSHQVWFLLSSNGSHGGVHSENM